MSALAIVVLAAGKGTRMKSDLVKVLHPLAGRPILSYLLDAARSLRPQRLVVVVGFQADLVEERCQGEGLVFVRQEEQLGTGHAVLAGAPALEGFRGDVLILCGDVPLLREETLAAFLQAHRERQAALSVLTTRLENPRGYGRVFRSPEGLLLRIVEERDLREGEGLVQEINTGIYCADAAFLFSALSHLSNRNAQKEYYLTDIAAWGHSRNEKVFPVLAGDPAEVVGINTRVELAGAGRVLRRRINERLMLEGVTLIDPESTYIDFGVTAGRDTVIHPGCSLLGNTSLGAGCVVEAGCRLSDARVGNGVTIRASSVVADTVIGDRAEVGPFAHLRASTVLREDSRIGNFVEVKKSVIGRQTRAAHLAYIGDAALGEDVNVGAGAITCNFDGREKHPTAIGDGAFIGSNAVLVAPVKIGRRAVIGAGSTITRDVPEGTLAVARPRQVHRRKRPKAED